MSSENGLPSENKPNEINHRFEFVDGSFDMTKGKIKCTERPILFSAPMVRAILDGRKTQTRRIVKDNGGDHDWGFPAKFQMETGMEDGCFIDASSDFKFCPYGNTGDRLWVRETFIPDHPSPHYRACATEANLKYLKETGKKWKPSIHMPRWASRITLEIVSVRVERLTSITEEDTRAEGYDGSTVVPGNEDLNCRAWFESLWNKINGEGSFRMNPWVWVIEFKRIDV